MCSIGNQWENYTRFIFEELETEANNRNIFYPISHKLNTRVKELLSQMFFESFEAEFLNLSPHSVCSIISSGSTSGLCIDSGKTSTNIVPVYEGIVMKESTTDYFKIDIGGETVTETFTSILSKRYSNYTFQSFHNNILLNTFKEKHFFVKPFLIAETKCSPIEYELPDSTKITVDAELFECTELLFNKDFGCDMIEDPPKTEHSLSELVSKSVSNWDKSLQEVLLKNIFVCGGNSLLKGFSERLENDLEKIYKTSDFKVVSPPQRNHSVFTGASILSLLSSFEKECITKEEYDEIGPSVSTKKF